MRCIDCILYITAEETGDETGCASGGDVSNPTKDVYCAEMDGDREEWENKQEQEMEEQDE